MVDEADGMPPLAYGFAGAQFEGRDAGSGPVHSSPSLGPMTTALHNITARNLHDIGTAVPDDRQFLRSWRRQLQECLQQQHCRILRFLLADISDARLSETDVMRRCQDVMTKYSKATWNFASSIRDLSLSTDLSDTLIAVEHEIGLAPGQLRDAMRRAIRMYTNTATTMCAAESMLEEKLKRLEAISGRINDMMFMEPTAELGALAEPTRVYLDSVLRKIDLEAEFRQLVAEYKKFAILRGLMTVGQFQRIGALPTCTICMTKEISQAVAPCGHTFCDDCCRTQMTACYICRVQIRDRLKLYFN
jgi:hypothetical protein